MTCVVLTPGAFARRAFAPEAFAVAPDIWARNSPADGIWIRDDAPPVGGWQLTSRTADRIIESGPVRITEAGEVRIVPAPRAQWTLDRA